MQHNPLIIGGGPGGAAAAIELARAGRRPLLIERDAVTRDALCGGFLSWATVARLNGIGIDPLALGAHPVDRLTLFAGSHRAEAALPRLAMALSRRALDNALLDRAASLGAGIERGTGVRALDQGHVRLDDGGEIDGSCIVLATGKHNLRGVERVRPARDAAIGLRWRLGSSPALTCMTRNHIELHLFRGGYAGLVLQEDGSANLCLTARRSRLAEDENRPERLLASIAQEAPLLAARLEAALTICTPQAVANIPYGWRALRGEAGLYRIGDQAGVIPSLAGEGISIAIASGLAAAQAILHGEPAERYQPAFARRLSRAVPLAGAIWHAAEHPAGARMLVAATRALPALAGAAARLTRIH